MRKPWWMRAMGWLALLVFAMNCFVLYEYSTSLQFHGQELGVVGLWGIGFILGLAWAASSAAVWLINRNARTQAAVTRDVIERTLAGRLETAKLELPLAETGVVCNGCKSVRAVIHCSSHRLTLCWRCAIQHDSPVCGYIIANRLAKPAREGKQEPHRVMTGPLNLG